MTSLPCLTEYQESVIFADWLRLHQIPFTHIVNESGGKGSPVYGAKLKRMGRSKGFPDYLIFIQKIVPKGVNDFSWKKGVGMTVVKGGKVTVKIAIEMKRRKGGKTSPEQLAWLDILGEAGFSAKVCNGFEEAKEFVERFL